MRRVDFYRVGEDGVAPVLFRIATRILDGGGRLLVVAEDEALAAALDRALWEQEPASFLPHARAGADDAGQPLLIAPTCAASNGARHVALADGVWRGEALAFDRAFLLFGEAGVEAARIAWREVKAADGVEPHFWAQDDGRWREIA